MARKNAMVKRNKVDNKHVEDADDFTFSCPFTMTIVGSTGCG